MQELEEQEDPEHHNHNDTHLRKDREDEPDLRPITDDKAENHNRTANQSRLGDIRQAKS